MWELRGTLDTARGIRITWVPIVVGSAVTLIATVHELLVIGLPWPVLLLLFVGTGALLLFVGANYEQRRRLRGAYRGMR